MSPPSWHRTDRTTALTKQPALVPLILPAHAEWEDPAWREETGWTGTDLCHSPTSPTHIVAYWWDPHAQTLTGLVRFNPNAGQLRHQASHGHSKHFEHRTPPTRLCHHTNRRC